MLETLNEAKNKLKKLNLKDSNQLNRKELILNILDDKHITSNKKSKVYLKN